MSVRLPHTRIVNFLRKYGEIEEDVLASKLEIAPADLTPYLDSLRKAGAIQIRGNKVRIVSSKSPEPSASAQG